MNKSTTLRRQSLRNTKRAVSRNTENSPPRKRTKRCSQIKKKRTTASNATKPLNTSPPKKKLRSQAPDVIVSVGKGEEGESFECYKFILSYASEYFDTMLSLPLRESETSHIELPDRDPKEWQIFYKFLDPSTHKEAKVTAENAMILASWFNEYQMGDLLKECDRIISSDEFLVSFLDVPMNYIIGFDENTDIIDSFWLQYRGEEGQTQVPKRTVETIAKLLEYYSICEQCSLADSSRRALKEVSRVMKGCFDLFVGQSDLMRRLVEIYESNQKTMASSHFLGKEADDFYSAIVKQGKVDWNDVMFKSWIDSKLENVVMKHFIRDLPGLFDKKFNPTLPHNGYNWNQNNEQQRVKRSAKDVLNSILESSA